MSQIIRIRNWSIHVPSVARARIVPTFLLRRPLIYMEGYHGQTMEASYLPSEWERAHEDFVRLQHSMAACRKALEHVPAVQPFYSSKDTKME